MYGGSSEETRSRFNAGSQSEHSEQYETSLSVGEGERREIGEEIWDGERVSCGRSKMVGGVLSLENRHAAISHIYVRAGELEDVLR